MNYVTAAACTGLVLAALVKVIWLLDNTIHQIKRLRRLIVSEAQDAVDAVTVQLGKAKDELVAKIDDLQAQVDAGEAPDLTALREAAQALDDVVPDAVPEPEPEPEPEEQV